MHQVPMHPTHINTEATDIDMVLKTPQQLVEDNDGI